ncbi:MAG: hypothetical protein WAN34_05100 [Acidimicrobiia bacterium]
MEYIFGIPLGMGLLSIGLFLVLRKRHFRWAATSAALTLCGFFTSWMVWEWTRPPVFGAADPIATLILIVWTPILLIILAIALAVDLILRRSSSRAPTSYTDRSGHR